MQASLDEYVTTPDLFDGAGYGATMDRPVPDSERAPAWKRQLRARGVSPGCLREAAGILTIHRERDLHPADEHRASHYPDAEERAIRRDLARQHGDPVPMSWREESLPVQHAKRHGLYGEEA